MLHNDPTNSEMELKDLDKYVEVIVSRLDQRKKAQSFAT